MENITEEIWRDKIANDHDAIILDVRTPAEWREGILENAICVDIHEQDNFLSEMEKADKSKNYYIYCRSGQRSAHACKVLDQLGAKNTYNLIGGIMAWSGEVVSYKE
ncbi:MAG: rhodanese-like domain-containing protein [Weeksellaceae bacterium]